MHSRMLLGSKNIDKSCRDSLDNSLDNYIVLSNSALLDESDKTCDALDAHSANLHQRLIALEAWQALRTSTI
jgi:hypothetical protein